MKYISWLLLFAATTALGSKVGDTYEQVIAEKGNPESQVEAGTLRILNYPDASIKFKDNVVVSISPIAGTPQEPATPAPTSEPTPQASIDAVQRELNAAVLQVKNIVNQPVTALERTPQMRVAIFSPGWFHPGAIRPDFNAVDIRSTQETATYDRNEYVSSDLNPGVAFLGRELEFNSMTKYFYTDRSVPKKKLTEPEMLEINRLYRIIGQCEQRLRQLQAR
jgi:hypothetical protein